MRRWTMAAVAVMLTGCGSANGQDSTPTSSGDTADASGDELQLQTASAQASTGARSENRAFRDWIAVCDNGNDCVAIGPASSDGQAGYGWVRIAMAAGPDAQPKVSMGLFLGNELDSVAPVLTVDGRRFRTAPKSGTIDGELTGGEVLADDAAAAALAIGQGRKATMQAARFTADITVTGAAAALLWIDERQGRLGTTTALIRRGGRAASSVPAAPALPRLVAAPAVSQAGFGETDQTLPASLEVLPKVKECRSETDFSPELSKAVVSARLDAERELWGVPCFAGAYNVGHDWYVTGPGGRDPRLQALPSADGQTSTSTINGAYDPETRTLSAFNKGRGLGDCGVASTWLWTGLAFALKSEENMQQCWGMTPELWPSTWRTR